MQRVRTSEMNECAVLCRAQIAEQGCLLDVGRHTLVHRSDGIYLEAAVIS